MYNKFGRLGFIETDGGIFDCGLGTQLSELKKRLMLLAYSREE